ncbi:MAG: hypothetical protein QXH78_02155 [Desulfurococcaceae archaeon]
MSLEQYISCLENCSMRYVEALAMLGLVVDVSIESCSEPRFKKILARLFDGKNVSTACYFEEEVYQSTKIIRVYIDIAKRNNALGKLQVAESAGTED